jgi:hypothetical protein
MTMQILSVYKGSEHGESFVSLLDLKRAGVKLVAWEVLAFLAQSDEDIDPKVISAAKRQALEHRIEDVRTTLEEIAHFDRH